MLLVYDFELAGEEFHMEVSSPSGGGEQFHILVNKYFHGTLVNAAIYDEIHKLLFRYWRPYLNAGSWLTGDDLSVIVDELPSL